MEKVKKSLISRASAIVLALALVIGTIPTSVINVRAAVDTEGTVEIINGVGGIVDSTDASNIIVKYEGEGVSIKHLESDDTVGRTSSGWFVGAVMNAPEGMTDFTNSTYTDVDSNNIPLGDVASVEPIHMWKQIDKTEFETAKEAGTDLEYIWEFDWDTTTDGTQKVVFTIDTDTVTLSDEDTVKPVVETVAANPSEWTNGEVIVSGTVSDNFSGVKSVSYKQQGTMEVKEAILTGNSFSFTVDATVYEGKYIVWCTDNKDNTSLEATVSVYMDNVAPTVTAEANVTDWTKEAVTISGTVEDVDSGVKEIYYQKTGETKVKLETFDATDGTYSITIPAQAYAGNYIIYCIDNAGNEASAVVSVKMDNNVPELTEVKADVEDWTNGSIVISGKVSDLLSGVASVTWEKEDDQTTGSATYNASDNTFTFEVGAQEYEGNYIITSTDNAGNTTAGNTVSVKMDNGVCVVATGAADKPDWTNESVTISGTVKDELSGIASVSWKMATGTESGYATFDEDKNEYTFEVGAQDYKGNYIITCTDKAGNVSAEFPVAVQMDVTNPSVESAVADMTDWTNESVVISGTVKDTLSGVASVAWERADGEASGNATYNEVDNTFTFTVDAQDYEGQYIITCRDKAGNVSDKQTVAVKMDNISPEFTVEVSTTDWTNEPIYVMGEFDENCSGIASLSYGKLGAEPYVLEMTGATTYGLTLGADDYNGKYYAYCTDAAGNNSDVIEFEVKMDKTAPTVESAEASTMAWTNKSVTISGTVSDLLSGVDKVTWVKEDDQTTGNANFDVANNKFNFEVPAQDYAGNYIITCTDKAGNVSAEVPVAVQMDKTAPTVTKAEADVTVWTNGQVVVSGTTEDNLSEVVSVTYKKTGDAEGKTAVYDADKNEYSIVLAADDYEGTYTIYCTDAAGNQSADVTVEVKMDKTAPTLSNVKADITDWTNGKVVISGNYDDNLSGVQVITVVKVDDKTTKTATMNEGDKTFSFEIPAQNYEGDYTITCTDAANNTSLEATVSVKMDNEQCKVVTGVAESADWTNKNVVISGTVSDNLSGVNKVHWEKADDAAKKGEATFDAAKKEYTFDVPAQDYAGNYIITCTDKAGNVSVEFPVEVKMDITSPVVEDAKASIAKWTNQSIVISGTVSDNLSGVETVTWVKEGDQTTGTAIFNADDNTFSFNVPAQDYEGKYIITCADKAGNVSEEVEVPVIMDITNPVVHSAVASTKKWTNQSIVINGTVSDNLSGVEIVTCVKESDNSELPVVYNEEDGTFAIDVPAQDYKGNYIITCTDRAGNVSAEVTVEVQMDITNPVVESAVASTTDWTKESVVISGTVSDILAGVETVTCIKESDNSELEVNYNVENGTFTVDVASQSYEGNYIITCTDKAGNVSAEAKVAVKMDNVAPNVLKLACGEKILEKIVDGITFGLFYNSEQTMVVDSKDDLSGIKTIEYIEKNVKIGDVITREVLDNEDWSKNAPLYIAESDHEIEKTGVQGKVPATPNRNIIYCVRVMDYAGNYDYRTSDGIIIDTTKSEGGLDKGKMVCPSELPMKGNEVVTVPDEESEIARPLYGKAAVGEDGVVTFDVNITEKTINGVLQSGIKKVSYKIEAKDRDAKEYLITQGAEHNLENVTEGDLYTWNANETLKTEFTGTITVDAARNNYNYVKVTVTVTDNAGNTTSDEYVIAIDITAPTLTMKYDDDTLSEYVGTDENSDKRGYYTEERIVYATYTERNENWNENVASAAIEESIKDMAGVEAEYDIEWKPEPTLGVTSDGDAYYAEITFKENIHYSLAPWTYTDAAGNDVELTIEGTQFPYVFSIDKFDKDEDSVAEIKIKDGSWFNELLDKITFGVFDLFSNVDTEVSVNVTDDFAGIREIKYLEKEYTDGEYTISPLEEDTVKKYEGWIEILAEDTDAREDKVRSEEFTKTIGKTLDGENINKNVVIFVWVTDYAGHDKILSSDGVIIDTTNPKGELANATKILLPTKDDQTVRNVPNTTKPLYGLEEVGTDNVVAFDVEISEHTLETILQEATENTEAVKQKVLQSGIKKVSYKVEAKDRDVNEYKITQGAEHDEATAENGGLLYQWDQKAVRSEFKDTIEVIATDNNYNYVRVTVTVEDNASNIVSETYELAIDITAPKVEISYSPEKPVDEDDEQGYFNCQRIATITYTERTENWNSADAAAKLVTALDINGEQVKDAYDINWDPEPMFGVTSDQDKHIATVLFNPTNILETEDVKIEDATESDETTESIDSTESTERETGADARHTIDTSYTDAAGNFVSWEETTVAEGTVYPFKFTIDTVKPELVEVVYEEQIGDTVLDVLTFNMFRYFGNNATVKITVKDETAGLKTFDFEGILDEGVSLKNKAVEKTIIEKLEQAETDEKESKELTIVQQKDKSEFVIEFKIPKEILTAENSFRGSLVVNAHDYCKNTSEPGVGANTQGNESYIPNTRLVVDKIAPTCQVTFDQPVNEVEGVSYYDKSFTATIVIDEANFYKEDVEISINGTRVMPTDWAQTPGTDIWTSHVSFIEENDYILTVNYTDRSGNVMTTYESNQRTLDTTQPVISVSNIKHESANNEETIGFVLTVTDKNMALANVKPQATAVIREGDSSANYTYKTVNIDLGTPAVTTNANGETVYTYTVTNLEIDGYYSLVCTVVDHANHSVSNIGSQSEDNRGVAVETVNFSVNRGGSVFWIETIHNDKYSDTTFNNELNGAYANDEVTVKLHEVNVDRVDELDADDKRTVLTLNDGNDSNTIELIENSNGNGNYDRNVRIGEGGWYETIYTLENDQFAKDGTYSLNIITYDKAENSNVNTKNEEGTIQFVVDRTNPVITTNVKSKQIIDANEYTVELTIAEVNLDESTLVVKLEGDEVEWTKVSNNTYQFTLDEAQWANFPNLSQDFEITAKDLAGNSAEVYQREDITVTDDVIIQVAAYMINRPLLLGLTGAGVVAIAGLTIFSVIWKKRKKYEA